METVRKEACAIEMMYTEELKHNVLSLKNMEYVLLVCNAFFSIYQNEYALLSARFSMYDGKVLTYQISSIFCLFLL